MVREVPVLTTGVLQVHDILDSSTCIEVPIQLFSTGIYTLWFSFRLAYIFDVYLECVEQI